MSGDSALERGIQYNLGCTQVSCLTSNCRSSVRSTSVVQMSQIPQILKRQDT